MKGYNDEMKPKPLINLAKVKALVIILSIILGSTFGLYYMGEWNYFEVGVHADPSKFNIWVLGLLNTIMFALGLFVTGVICYLLYMLYEHLVKEFS